MKIKSILKSLVGDKMFGYYDRSGPGNLNKPIRGGSATGDGPTGR